MIEQQVIDILRARFELHGFGPIHTRAVEPLESLLAKGETDKEIYVLRRLHAGPDESDSGLGLHFDLTVPLARFVGDNAGNLAWPLRRYQIQKAWRGERPQDGRYREFLQADIDVVGQGSLPAHFESEVPLVAADALRHLPLPPFQIQVSNRKLVEGFLRGVGIADSTGVLRAMDKLDKIGSAEVRTSLVEQLGSSQAQADACLALAQVRSADLGFITAVERLGVHDELLDQGVAELAAVIEAGRNVEPGLFVADLRVARGLDYYTGTVYETILSGHESIGSICSGGRYDNLVSSGDKRYPGVGVSIGVSRLLGRLFDRGILAATRKVPTCVLVAVPDEDHRSWCDRIAAALRGRGIPTEVAPEASKYGKQIRYAEARGIPYVWFPDTDNGSGAVRDIRSGAQRPAEPESWEPPDDDLHVRIFSAHPSSD